jgi:Zn-finger nucleic acid-binding protein
MRLTCPECHYCLRIRSEEGFIYIYCLNCGYMTTDAGILDEDELQVLGDDDAETS